MVIINKVKLVEKLFGLLDTEISAFQSKANLQCISGCGNCCTKPDIETSQVEFLQWAFSLFLNCKA